MHTHGQPTWSPSGKAFIIMNFAYFDLVYQISIGSPLLLLLNFVPFWKSFCSLLSMRGQAAQSLITPIITQKPCLCFWLDQYCVFESRVVYSVVPNTCIFFSRTHLKVTLCIWNIQHKHINIEVTQLIVNSYSCFLFMCSGVHHCPIAPVLSIIIHDNTINYMTVCCCVWECLLVSDLERKSVAKECTYIVHSH